MFLLSNLLIGNLPDAVGLMIFGIFMVLTATVLRKMIAGESVGDQGETGIEGRV